MTRFARSGGLGQRGDDRKVQQNGITHPNAVFGRLVAAVAVAVAGVGMLADPPAAAAAGLFARRFG